MKLPSNKTKIVCTVGPASDAPEILEAMIHSGMNVARLNFSHGDLDKHRQTVDKIRAAAAATERRVAIMADLPGPKIRIGEFAEEPILLQPGDRFALTTADVEGDRQRVSVNFDRLPQVVQAGDRLFLNDGIVHLKALKVSGREVICETVVGGELRSRKGLNLPGIDLGIPAFTEHDRRCLEFALELGVDAISQSFVESAVDVNAVRRAASDLGKEPFIIAKIERRRALDFIDDILRAADGIMVARGDLGVEIPIEEIAVVQKELMRKANRLGKPVITATQMLESMITNRRPTRAESTDVANAILDGTDCVMLSGESAMGNYPIAAVEMLAAIAAAIEPHCSGRRLLEETQSRVEEKELHLPDLIALGVETTLQRITPVAVIVPTRSGTTARRIVRFRLPVWTVAVSSLEKTCQDLLFSYGVLPVCEPDHPTNWKTWIRRFLQELDLSGDLVVLTEGPSQKHPERNNRMEIIDLRRK